jgi:hypothetical protein
MYITPLPVIVPTKSHDIWNDPNIEPVSLHLTRKKGRRSDQEIGPFQESDDPTRVSSGKLGKAASPQDENCRDLEKPAQQTSGIGQHEAKAAINLDEHQIDLLPVSGYRPDNIGQTQCTI